jgi:ribose 5-phosphate isomerase A
MRNAGALRKVNGSVRRVMFGSQKELKRLFAPAPLTTGDDRDAYARQPESGLRQAAVRVPSGTWLMGRDAQKKAAAEAAAALVEDGMVVGLGTGSTAWFAIEALIRRVRQGLSIQGIPTSERSAAQARAGGIALTSFAERRRLDITIDGADEIQSGSLNLVKGLGGALLREKIVAAASDRLVIVADARKRVEQLGSTVRLPVEIVPFGWETTADRLARLDAKPVLRVTDNGAPFRTDGGNLIVDCDFGPIADPAALDLAIGQTIGVVETGLFIGMARLAVVADDAGIHRLTPCDGA